jgi:GntR family transcriptional regulator, transcriptional repressor for pyruvate dehydrogenase complex
MRAKSAMEMSKQDEHASDGVPVRADVREINPISLAKIPKTGELIAGELRKQIVRGELAEGASLPAEADLMAQLSVSRASLREALRVLESESLLTVRRGSRGGPVVHRPNPNLATKYFGLVLQSDGATLEDVYIARLLIEPPAVRMAVENARGKVPDSLRRIVNEEHVALKNRDFAEIGRGITRFHGALMELSGNKTMFLIMKMLNIIYELHIAAIDQIGATFDQLEASRRSVKAQERLIAFIEAKAADEAVDYWHTHLLKVKEYLFSTDAVHKVIDVV